MLASGFLLIWIYVRLESVPLLNSVSLCPVYILYLFSSSHLSLVIVPLLMHSYLVSFLSLSLSISVFHSLLLWLSVCLSNCFLCVFACLFIYLIVCLSVCLYLLVCQFVYPPVSICWCICLSQSTCLPDGLFIYLSVHLSIWLTDGICLVTFLS